MKKLLTATIVASLMATGAAFAMSVPVLDIEQGQTHVTVDRAFDYKAALPEIVMQSTVGVANPSLDGYSLTADYGITDDIAVQLGYTKLSTDIAMGRAPRSRRPGPHGGIISGKLNSFELNGYYAVNDNINLFAGLQRFDAKTDTQFIIDDVGTGSFVKETSVNVGAVVHAPIADKVTAFGKIAFGNKNIERQIQVGLRYDINENVEVHAMYEHNKVDLRLNKDLPLPPFVQKIEGPDINGFSVGFGYRF